MEFELSGAVAGRVQLGQVVHLRWDSADPATELRAFVRSGAVRYVKPIVEWTREREIPFYLEAPGRYGIVAQWRNAAGRRQQELAIEVETNAPLERPGPARAQLGGDSWLWAPSSWDANVLEVAEQGLLSALRDRVRPGDTVYDIGANLGLYALHFAAWVGDAGRVYCVEANPVCVSYLQGSLSGPERTNVEILPIAILDHTGEVDFAINYANTNIGITAASGFYASKLGHRVRVGCTSLDELIAEHELRAPSIIKMDIEGAEAFALRGMRASLAKHRPALALELHGAGNALASFEELDPLGYRYADAAGNDFASGAEVVKAFGDRVFQILATA